MFDRQRAVVHLVFADNQGVAGLRRIRFFHLRFETPQSVRARAVQHHIQADLAQMPSHAKGHSLRRLTLMHHIHVTADIGLFRQYVLREQQQALQTHAKTHRRCRFATQNFKQAIVATAAADRALRTQIRADPLKHRVRVVVQTTHQTRIHRECHTHVGQQTLHLGKMRTRRFAQMLG